MNEKNNKRQLEKKRLEQKKVLFQMKQEMEALEYEIKNASSVNAKIKAVRNLKISARAIQRIAPYAITAGLIFGGFTLLGDIPFYPNDEWKIYSRTMTEFDSMGNIRKEQQYDNFKKENDTSLDNSDSVLYYYSKWQRCDNEFYSRTIQTYSIKKKSFEDMMELFKKEDLKLEDIFGEPISNIKETKNNVTNEELQEEPIMKAIIYNKDKNDYIMQKETVGDNIGLSILYLFITFLFELIPLYYRYEHSSFDFSDCVDDIKRNHQPINIEELKKKLEIKKENYDRLVR